MFRIGRRGWVVLAVLLGACSNGGPTSGEPVVSLGPSSVAASTPDASSSAAGADVAGPVAKVEATVGMHVELDEPSTEAELSAPTGADGDPFGDFATCSGVRGAVGAYVVGVGSSSGPVRWLSVVTSTRLTGAGTVDADVRVELGDGTNIEATGTTTISSDLASGTFVAFDAAGSRVAGSFECRGATEPPALISASETGSIEVLALLRRSGNERVVSAALVDAADADCPVGDGQPLILRIDGGDALGAITTFELSRDGSSSAVMRMRIGGTVVEFDGVDVSIAESSRAGTFSAAHGNLSVDGAFSCT
jgi:hypothetical protein